MTKQKFKAQASSGRVDPGTGSGSFRRAFAGSTLSYLSEPPNLSSITDANVVVAFKNLLKKDGTTKAKGVEDLRSFVQLHPYEMDGGVEQPILEAWVKLYPRISIDNSRRVRELSHNLQYELLKSARKRMEKSIPSIVGPWLAGTYDRDRQVARAATDGMTSFLDTEDKVLSFWRRCQPQILDYVQEALQETPQTLSDERTVNSDDAQAKYDRVVGASLSLVVNLLTKLGAHETQKHQAAYEGFLSGNKMLWGFVASNNAFLRRTTAQLLSVCLDKQSEIIEKDLELVSHTFIAEGLRSSQSSSSLLFLTALNKLTHKFPQVWLTTYKGKKSPLSRLRHFIEKGSQGGPPEYWQVFSSLIGKLPRDILPTDLDGAVDFLKTQRDGISSREEARANASAAWTSYFEVAKHLGAGLSDVTTYEQLLCVTVFPVFEQFLSPVPEHSRWSVSSSTVTLAKAFRLCSMSENGEYPESLREEWSRLAQLLITNMLTSLPEQSKDYSISQAAIVAEAHRWFGLQAEIIRSAKSLDSKIPLEPVVAFLAGPCSSVILKALETLVSRNGKPYGVAGTLEAALRITPEVVSALPSIQNAIASFLGKEFPKLVISPSSKYLIASLNAFRLLPEQDLAFTAIWQAAMNALLATPDSAGKTSAVQGLISSHAGSQLAQQDDGLQKYLLDNVSRLVQSQLEDWSTFESAITFDSLSMETMNCIISILVDSLGDHVIAIDSPLRALEFIAQRKPQFLQSGDATHLAIMARLLSLTESSDHATVSRASTLKATIERGDNTASNLGQAVSPILEIIKENLENADPQSLTIDTLVQQAETFIDVADGKLSAMLLPDPVLWSKALQPFLFGKPNPGLSFTSLLGPLISIVQPTPIERPSQPLRDLNGYSIAFRMALYTSKLLTKREEFQHLPENDQVDILRPLSLTMLLASDQLGLGEDNQLWSLLADPDGDSQVQDFVDSAQTFLTVTLSYAPAWRYDARDDQSTVARGLVSNLMEASKGTSPVAFYTARSLSNIITMLVEAYGWKALGGDEWLSSLDVLKPSTSNLFTAVAVLSGLQEVLGTSKLVNNLCNRLISDITGALPKEEKTLSLLILLNATLAVYEPGNLPVAQNRLVFAVKQITSWMGENQNLSASLAAEACRSLQFLLPSIKEVYGPYWQAALTFCVDFWKNEYRNEALNERLPALSASLRLVVLMKGLQDPNDDLSESLTASAESISEGLLQLLRLPRAEENQPWRIFDELLCRQIMQMPQSHVKDLSILYPLVASDFHFIQLAAFHTLNRAIPAAQEQISLDVLLEKRDARLPEELLSLLLDAPSYQALPDEVLAGFHPQIRSYLFSWHLVFDSYFNASYKVRNDYSEILESENYISPLLDFLFDVLGHSAAHALNLDKTGFTPELIQFYDIKLAEADTDERNVQWLLINLYYLCLKFAPNLAKNWWMNCKSKQTRIAVESWTEKYFSPLVIADTLDEVSIWAEQQEAASEDEKDLAVKVSKKSREVYAGYEVDDTQIQIAIRLPAAYPLEGVRVDGINRVAVSERKWQSWLMITQGAIKFSNGSITDGLTIFRKNVTGALKGQTECAICYSIISSDKKIPDKRCQTCKNLFHSSCLFKWFASSNQSTCPLCRNPFNYGTDVASRARRRGGPE